MKWYERKREREREREKEKGWIKHLKENGTFTACGILVCLGIESLVLVVREVLVDEGIQECAWIGENE
jgi:hypothetical protein